MATKKETALTTKSSLENLVTEGIKIATNQQTLNAVSVATFAKTFFGLTEKQAAAMGVGYALLTEHLNAKEPF